MGVPSTTACGALRVEVSFEGEVCLMLMLMGVLILMSERTRRVGAAAAEVIFGDGWK